MVVAAAEGVAEFAPGLTELVAPGVVGAGSVLAVGELLAPPGVAPTAGTVAVAPGKGLHCMSPSHR